MIRARQLLKDFPNRTEGDFFVWLLDHQARLTKEMGWHVRMDAALTDLAQKVYTSAEGISTRFRSTLLAALPLVQKTPPTGQWREEHQTRPGRMFGEILVSLTGQPPWPALACALTLAGHEHAQVYGVYLSASKMATESQSELQTHFDTQCQEAGIDGRLVFLSGKVAAILSERSRWVDLVVASLEQEHPARGGNRGPSFRAFLQHCHTPALIFPGTFTFPTRALLAYDGSKKADEALFLAAYLSSFWGLDLVIFSVIPFEKGHPLPPPLAYAEEYLRNYHIQAQFCHGHGDAAEEILRAAQRHTCNLILMGGYGEVPLLGGFRRRTVDAVLAATQAPVLVCR